jgi:hypothetical protein
MDIILTVTKAGTFPIVHEEKDLNGTSIKNNCPQ